LLLLLWPGFYTTSRASIVAGTGAGSLPAEDGRREPLTAGSPYLKTSSSGEDPRPRWQTGWYLPRSTRTSPPPRSSQRRIEERSRAADLEQVVEFIDVAEYGVALEWLVALLAEGGIPLSVDEREEILRLARLMGIEDELREELGRVPAAG
jgi:hypothetical protein